MSLLGAESGAGGVVADLIQFRRFRERPNLIFVNQIRDLIQQTGLPEDIPELYRGQISRDEKFYRLADVHIEKGKRPNGDNAPCPRCTPNKFLSGVLAYLPRLEAVACIGHCCAGAEAQAEADRDYKQRANQLSEEGYPTPTTLGQQLRSARRRLGLPISEAAKLVAIDAGTSGYGNWIVWRQGHRRKRWQVSWRICLGNRANFFRRSAFS
jgi:hypothetical protein